MCRLNLFNQVYFFTYIHNTKSIILAYISCRLRIKRPFATMELKKKYYRKFNDQISVITGYSYFRRNRHKADRRSNIPKTNTQHTKHDGSAYQLQTHRQDGAVYIQSGVTALVAACRSCRIIVSSSFSYIKLRKHVHCVPEYVCEV